MRSLDLSLKVTSKSILDLWTETRAAFLRELLRQHQKAVSTPTSESGKIPSACSSMKLCILKAYARGASRRKSIKTRKPTRKAKLINQTSHSTAALGRSKLTLANTSSSANIELMPAFYLVSSSTMCSHSSKARSAAI